MSWFVSVVIVRVVLPLVCGIGVLPQRNSPTGLGSLGFSGPNPSPTSSSARQGRPTETYSSTGRSLRSRGQPFYVSLIYYTLDISSL